MNSQQLKLDVKNVIKYRKGYKYQLAETYIIPIIIHPIDNIVTDFIELTPDGIITIKKGYAWDGPSGPTIDTKNFMRGSLVHDALYQLMREKHLPLSCKPFADEELVRICKEDGMCSIRRWWVYKGVKDFGLHSAEPQDEKIITAP